jgi:replication factor A1
VEVVVSKHGVLISAQPTAGFPPQQQQAQQTFQQQPQVQQYQQAPMHNPQNLPRGPPQSMGIYNSVKPEQMPNPSVYGQQQQPVSSMYGTSAVPAQSAYGGQMNRQPVVRSEAAPNIIPIAALNPYMNKWAFKARITSKSDVRSWNNARGSGTLFSIDMLDAQGTEIKGTFFKEASDKFYPILEQGGAYIFSGGKIGPVKDKKWSTLKNDYEIVFDQNTVIEPSESAEISAAKYDFVKFSQIANIEINSTIDVIGLVRSVGDPQDLVSKAGKALRKREITLTDDSGFDVRLTIWGDKCSIDISPDSTPIVAIKYCKVGDYQGRTLSTSMNSTILVNPDIPEGHTLYQFKVQNGDALPTGQSLSTGGGDKNNDGIDKRKSLVSIVEDGMGLSEKPDYVSVKGTVTFIKHDQDDGPWYTACPGEGCNKKVIQGLGDSWQCEKCNREYSSCNRRYILSMSLADHTGTQWVSLFDEQAQQLLGHSAEDLHQMKISGDDAAYERVFADALFKQLCIRLRVKQEMVNDEPRLKCTSFSMGSVDFAAESKQLLLAISKYD